MAATTRSSLFIWSASRAEQSSARDPETYPPTALHLLLVTRSFPISGDYSHRQRRRTEHSIQRENHDPFPKNDPVCNAVDDCAALNGPMT